MYPFWGEMECWAISCVCLLGIWRPRKIEFLESLSILLCTDMIKTGEKERVGNFTCDSPTMAGQDHNR